MTVNQQNSEATTHNAQILDQFTRQAEPFIQRHAHHNDALLELMGECAALPVSATVLDVACGPGIVSCFFARRVGHVTGLDFVPAMLERARRFQEEQQVPGIDWRQGDSTALPFPDSTFDGVITRFSFHHFLEPAKALIEMKRVCKPSGVVLVCDVAPRNEAQDGFNEWEILRDPSHTRALSEDEFDALGEEAGLPLLRKARFTLEMDLEALLSSSFPEEGNAGRIRALFEKDILGGTDRLGVSASRRNAADSVDDPQNGAVKIFYPVLVLAWRKPA